MSSVILLLTKVLTLLVLIVAIVMIATRRDAWGRLLLLTFLAIVHGRRVVRQAIGRF